MRARSSNAWWSPAGAAIVLATPFAGTMCAAGTAAPVDHDGLARCAAISADDRRLACYDALANGLGLQRSTGAPAAGATPSAAGKPAANPTSPTSVTSANPPSNGDVMLFGLNKPLEPVARGPESLQSTVAAVSTDALGTTSVLLDNGQVWTFNEGNVLLRNGDAIVIKRAALGSFIMSTPTKRTYRVHRLK